LPYAHAKVDVDDEMMVTMLLLIMTMMMTMILLMPTKFAPFKGHAPV
jgi:hypothetical protein